jgi:ferritin-like metal-binding protein YciE
MEDVMPGLRAPEDILTTELKEIYSAERQLSRAMQRMMKKVSSDRLREMLQQRMQQGEQLIEQLDDAFEEMEVTKGRQKNVAAEGLIEDVNHHLEEIEDERLCDPFVLASVQKIEHYCIASWGAARSIGQLLGNQTVVKQMERVLKEGKEFDEEMTKLAEEEINPQMMSDGESESEDGEGEEEESSSKSSSSRKSSSRSRGSRSH